MLGVPMNKQKGGEGKQGLYLRFPSFPERGEGLPALEWEITEDLEVEPGDVR